MGSMTQFYLTFLSLMQPHQPSVHCIVAVCVWIYFDLHQPFSECWTEESKRHEMGLKNGDRILPHSSATRFHSLLLPFCIPATSPLCIEAPLFLPVHHPQPETTYLHHQKSPSTEVSPKWESPLPWLQHLKGIHRKDIFKCLTHSNTYSCKHTLLLAHTLFWNGAGLPS